MVSVKRYIIISAAALITVSCGRGSHPADAQADSLRVALMEKDALIEQVFESLGRITSNLEQIKERESIVASGLDYGEIRKMPDRQIRDDLDAIDELLRNNRETISRLEATASRLSGLESRIPSLEAYIADITRQVEEKDAEILLLLSDLETITAEAGRLGEQVDELSGQIEEVRAHAQNLESEIGVRTDMLNTAYYIIGTEKELLNKDIVYKSGFIGRTLKINNNRDLEVFTRVDIRDFDEIAVGHKKITVVSSHPADSYTLIMDDKGVYQKLMITDRSRFWEFSKVLVISYK